MNEQQQSIFFRQLQGSLKAGISLGQTIRLAGQGVRSSRQRQAWMSVSLQLDQGKSLREAIKPMAKEFSPWTMAMVAMAEESGALAIACGDIAITLVELAERRRLFRSMVFRMSRMIWSWAMVIYLLVGGALIGGKFWLVGTGVALGLVLFLYGCLHWSPLGDRLRLMPPFKKLFDLQTLVNLGYLQLPLDCGLSLSAALDWLRKDWPDPNLRKILRRVEPQVRRGQPLSIAIGSDIPLITLQMIQTGETAGTLPLSFEQIRQYHHRELRRAIQVLDLQVLILSMVSFGCFVALVGMQVLDFTQRNLPGN